VVGRGGRLLCLVCISATGGKPAGERGGEGKQEVESRKARAGGRGQQRKSHSSAAIACKTSAVL